MTTRARFGSRLGISNFRTKIGLLVVVLAIAVVSLPSIFLFGGFDKTENVDRTASTLALEENLVGMGYRDVSISGCWLRFARDLEPSEINRWTSGYERIVNIDYFRDFSRQEVTRGLNGNTVYFILDVPLDDQYPLDTRAPVEFENWAERFFLGVQWPWSESPESREPVPSVERALEANFDDLDQLNRWISFQETGKSTQVETSFVLTWKEEISLNDFKRIITAYAKESDCNVEK